MSTAKKRTISGIICLLSILVIIALNMGYNSIKNDLESLKAAGSIFSWFQAGNSTTNNPVGIFGIVFGYVFIYLLGFWFSLIGFILIALISFQYFLAPEAEKGRQKLSGAVSFSSGKNAFIYRQPREADILLFWLWSRRQCHYPADENCQQEFSGSR